MGARRTSGADPTLCGFGLCPSRHSKIGEKSNLWRLERVETPVGLLSPRPSSLNAGCRALPGCLSSLYWTWSHKYLHRMIHPNSLTCLCAIKSVPHTADVVIHAETHPRHHLKVSTGKLGTANRTVCPTPSGAVPQCCCDRPNTLSYPCTHPRLTVPSLSIPSRNAAVTLMLIPLWSKKRILSSHKAIFPQRSQRGGTRLPQSKNPAC